MAHNVAAIYAHYMGPYDGNPVNLNPLPPQSAARKYLEYMGGSEAVLTRARADFDAGEFRWVVEALDHVVFAEPENRAARDLCADAMEQLGYQAESATWRNSYLLAARELRGRSAAAAPRGVAISPDVVAVLPLGSFLEYLAIRLDGERAQSLSARIDWRLLDDASAESQRITVSNGALNHLPGSHGEQAHARHRNHAGAVGQSLGRARHAAGRARDWGVACHRRSGAGARALRAPGRVRPDVQRRRTLIERPAGPCKLAPRAKALSAVPGHPPGTGAPAHFFNCSSRFAGGRSSVKGTGHCSGASISTPPCRAVTTRSSAIRSTVVWVSMSPDLPKVLPIGKFKNKLRGGFTLAVRSRPVEMHTVGMPASSTTRDTKPTV